MKPNLKLTGSFNEEVSIDHGVSIVSDPRTQITSSPVRQLSTIAITTSSDVTIEDLEISGGRAAGLLNSQGKLTAVRLHVFGNGALGLGVKSLVMRDSIIANNRGGGVSVAGDLSMTNCLVVANGDGTINDTGGLSVGTTSAARAVRFSTIANNVNRATSSYSPGIDCGQGVSGVVVGDSNIVTGNASSANCILDFSLFSGGIVSMHNRVGIPQFKNTTVSNPLAPDFYRIDVGSDAIDGGNPAGATSFDIDGDARPQGAGFDIGADEYKP